ncbi:MAG: RDD family protein [Bryobacteraceae bacterium]
MPGPRPPSVFDAGYATWANRVIGFLIDGLLIGAGMAILYLVLGSVLTGIAGLGGHDAASGMCCMLLLLFPVATLLVGFYNSVYLIAQRGFSIGQGVVKVKVVDAYGNLLSQGNAFVRLLARVALAFVPFGSLLDMLWPLWDDRRQTLHDKAVGCYVVNNPSGM